MDYKKAIRVGVGFALLLSIQVFSAQSFMKEAGFSGDIEILYHQMDLSPADDRVEKASFALQRLSLQWNRQWEKLYFEAAGRFDSWEGKPGLDEALLQWEWLPFIGVRAGQFKRPLSFEESEKPHLRLTPLKTQLFNEFLTVENGYLGYDLGVSLFGFLEYNGRWSYTLGLFNGRAQGPEGYGRNPGVGDSDVRGKDIAGRITFQPFRWVEVEASMTIKGIEVPENDLGIAIDRATIFGMWLEWLHYRIRGEIAFGDNHRGVDSLIVRGATPFFAFYIMPSMKIPLSGERAVEFLLRWEGLDPSVEDEFKNRNDGLFTYLAGVNYYLATWSSIHLAYSLLHPITKLENNDHGVQSIQAQWRANW